MTNPLVLNDALIIELKAKELKNNIINSVTLNVPPNNQPPLELASITLNIDNKYNPVWLDATIGWQGSIDNPRVIFSILRQVNNSSFVEICNTKVGAEANWEIYYGTNFSQVDIPPISCCDSGKVTYKLVAVRDDTLTTRGAQIIGPITFLGVEYKKNENVNIETI